MQAITSVRNYIEQIPANSWTATFIMLVPIIYILFVTIKEKQWEKSNTLKEIASRKNGKLEETEKAHPQWKDLSLPHFHEDHINPEYIAYITAKRDFNKKVCDDAKNVYPAIGHLSNLVTRAKSNYHLHIIPIMVTPIFAKLPVTFAVLYVSAIIISHVYVYIKSSRLDKLSLDISAEIVVISGAHNFYPYKEEVERRARHADDDRITIPLLNKA